MTYLTISTEDLAALAFSSAVGSLGLSGAIYLFIALKNLGWNSEPVFVAALLCGAIALAAYVWFFGLFVRVRQRSGISGWRIFGE